MNKKFKFYLFNVLLMIICVVQINQVNASLVNKENKIVVKNTTNLFSSTEDPNEYSRLLKRIDDPNLKVSMQVREELKTFLTSIYNPYTDWSLINWKDEYDKVKTIEAQKFGFNTYNLDDIDFQAFETFLNQILNSNKSVVYVLENTHKEIGEATAIKTQFDRNIDINLISGPNIVKKGQNVPGTKDIVVSAQPYFNEWFNRFEIPCKFTHL